MTTPGKDHPMRTRALLLAAALVPASIASLAFAPTVGTAELEDCSVLETLETTDDETGETTTDDVLACPSASYLAGCDDAAGGKVYHQVVQGPAPLDLAAPQESFTAGAGCGTYEEPLFFGTTPGNPFYDFTFSGFVTGNIDELTVELHDIYVAQQRAGGDIELAVRVEVDGESLFGVEEVEAVNGDVSTTPRIIDVPVTPEVSETGLSEALRFSVGDLYDQLGTTGAIGDGSESFHTVRVTVSVPPGVHALVWGASEIPSGIYVNQGLQGTVLQHGTGTVVSQG